MSQPCLITYDISSRKRLARLHRRLKQYATPIQYSVFYAELTEATLRTVSNMIEGLIHPKEDDVRIYKLPRAGWACQIGKASLPTGIGWTGIPPAWRSLKRPEMWGPDDTEQFADTEQQQDDILPKVADQRSPFKQHRKRHLTRTQVLRQRSLQARVQTGERRGIVVLGK